MAPEDIVIKATVGNETRRCTVKSSVHSPDELYPLIIAQISRVFNASMSKFRFFYTDPEGTTCTFAEQTLDDALACTDSSVLKLFSAPLAAQFDEEKQHEKDTAPIPQSMEPGTDTTLSPQATVLIRHLRCV